MYNVYINLDENKVCEAWIHELNKEKDISKSILIGSYNTPRLIVCGSENPPLKDDMGCYLYVYEDGKVRPISNEELIYEIDHIKYNLYAKANKEGFVIEVVSDKIGYKPLDDDIFIKRTTGDFNERIREYRIKDENGFYNYKISDGKMVEIPLQDKIESVKISKINELQAYCNEAITEGFNIEEDHYSLTIEDQINIQSLYMKATTGAGKLLYHADGKEMREYSKEEVEELFIKMEEVKNTNLTLFRKLKLDIERSNDAEYVHSLKFE